VRHRDAVTLLSGARLDATRPSTWVDLGSGDGTFTLALADLLASGSVIHALDLDRAAVSRIPPHASVCIEPHVADFTVDPWPVSSVDGILMANSLHYVASQSAFLESCFARMAHVGSFLVVEYDTDVANPWVPHPVSRRRLEALSAGFGAMTVVGSRPSMYPRAGLYAAVVRRGIISRVGA
jgi:trans-aconitate methyltransferase